MYSVVDGFSVTWQIGIQLETERRVCAENQCETIQFSS